MKVKPGTEEHKELFCREFLDTHIPFKPEELEWPDLTPETLEKLKGFPIWDHAVYTESRVGVKLTAYAKVVEGPPPSGSHRTTRVRRNASTLIFSDVFENNMTSLLKKYLNLPWKRTWKKSFMTTGAGECIDSFFAFGFIEISKSSNDYPLSLIEVMEPIIKEEARHILFIQNWLLYNRHSKGIPLFSLDKHNAGFCKCRLYPVKRPEENGRKFFYYPGHRHREIFTESESIH